MLLLDNSLIKLYRKGSFEKRVHFLVLVFLKYVFRIVKVSLWKSESPVSRLSELQKLLGLFVNNRSITFGLSGFLKHVVFFN